MSNALIPYQDIQNMALAVVKGRLFPEIDTPEKAVTLMLLCQAEGLHPMTALRRYHLIKGRPAMKADAMLAEFYRRGGTVEWHSVSETICDATFTSKGVPNGLRIAWTLEDAKRAGLAAKDNWKMYPRAMLRARTTSEGIRATDPAVNGGVYTEEEVQDFPDEPKPALPPDPNRVEAAVAVVESAPPQAGVPDPWPGDAQGETPNGLPPIPDECICGSVVKSYFSTSKRYLGRRYFQCEAAYQQKERLLSEGKSNAAANAAVDSHFRDWAERWPSDAAPQPEEAR